MNLDYLVYFLHPTDQFFLTFLGNAVFDIVESYKRLLSGDTFGVEKHFSKAYIPLNARSGLENQDYTINEDDISYCPHNPSMLRNMFVIKTLKKFTDNVFAKIPSPLQDVSGWSAFI